MILVFGSLNVDLVFPVAALPRPGETVLTESYTVVPGGKGANQAVAAARAGAAVRMFGRVGDDGFGRFARDAVMAAGVDVTGVDPSPRPTGCAVISVDPGGHNAITVGSGANLDAHAGQVPDAALSGGATVLLQMEVPAAESWALARRARAQGARVILNLAPARPAALEDLARIDLLVVNDIEAAALAAAQGLDDQDVSAAARALAARAGIPVVVTLGAAGAVAWGPDGGWSIGSLPVQVVDTTAAGDAFVGVLAAGLDAGEDLPASLHRASVAAGLACAAMGAQPSLPGAPAIAARLADLAPARRMA